MPRPRSFLLCLALATLTVVGASAKERVMVGDDIYVGPDEVLDEVVCMMCNVTIDGRVGEAVAIMGGMIINGEVERDAVAIMGGMDVRGGKIGGDVAAIMGGANVRDGGSIGGDAVAVLGGIDLKDGATVGGDSVSVLGGISKHGSAVVLGDEVSQGEEFGPIALAAALGIGLLVLIAVIAFLPVVSAIVLAVAGEQRIEVVRQTLNQRFGMCFLIGLGVSIGSFILSILLGIALFWLPGANTIITIGGFVVAAVGYTGLSLWVGRGLMRSGGAMGATVLGAILITFIQAVPIIGWFLLWPFFGCLATGAAVVSGFGTSVDWLLSRAEAEPIARPT